MLGPRGAPPALDVLLGGSKEDTYAQLQIGNAPPRMSRRCFKGYGTIQEDQIVNDAGISPPVSSWMRQQLSQQARSPGQDQVEIREKSSSTIMISKPQPQDEKRSLHRLVTGMHQKRQTLTFRSLLKELVIAGCRSSSIADIAA